MKAAVVLISIDGFSAALFHDASLKVIAAKIICR
jgi:hypothetical protein